MGHTVLNVSLMSTLSVCSSPCQLSVKAPLPINGFDSHRGVRCTRSAERELSRLLTVVVVSTAYCRSVRLPRALSPLTLFFDIVRGGREKNGSSIKSRVTPDNGLEWDKKAFHHPALAATAAWWKVEYEEQRHLYICAPFITHRQYLLLSLSLSLSISFVLAMTACNNHCKIRQKEHHMETLCLIKKSKTKTTWS